MGIRAREGIEKLLAANTIAERDGFMKSPCRVSRRASSPRILAIGAASTVDTPDGESIVTSFRGTYWEVRHQRSLPGRPNRRREAASALAMSRADSRSNCSKVRWLTTTSSSLSDGTGIACHDPDHPHIARFVDRGMTEDGLPYLAMEFIEGGAVDRYCDETKPPPRDVLKLLLSICEAVAFVHRHGGAPPRSIACEYSHHSWDGAHRGWSISESPSLRGQVGWA